MHNKTNMLIKQLAPSAIVLIILNMFAVVLVAMSVSGCKNRISWSDITGWFDKPEAEEESSTNDAVAFSNLVWRYGGFNGSNATLADDGPRLINPSCNGRRFSYTWKTGLDIWGLSYDEASAICAIFIEDTATGMWIGGKFDWISTSRSFRDLNHLTTYTNWPTSGYKLPLTGRVAFVVVCRNGQRRSNVIMTTIH